MLENTQLNSGMMRLSDDISYNRNWVLGRGTNGVVFKGFHHKHQKIIAVKSIKRNMVREEFILRQIKLMIQISQRNHPNIVQCYGWDINRQYISYYLEYCQGGSLADLIKRHQYKQIQIVGYFKQILEGLLFLGKMNILHRDLKPENILIGEDNEIKICDFGSAREYGNIMTQGNKCLCTPLYAPPQFLIQNLNCYDERCDVWSLGLILYEMLTGQHLFQVNNSFQRLKEQIKKLSIRCQLKKLQQYHKLWTTLIQAMLIYDYKQRPTLTELKSIFEEFQVVIRSDFINQNKLVSLFDSLKSTLPLHSNLNSIQPNPEEKNNQLRKTFKKEMDQAEKHFQFLLIKFKILQKMKVKFRSYLKIENAHICLVTFLAFAAFTVKIEKLLEQLEKQELILPSKQKITKEKLSEEEKSIWNNFIKNSKSQLKEILSENNTLLMTISKQIQISESKPSYSDILDQFDSATSLIKLYPTKFEEDSYERLYDELLMMDQLRIPKQELSSCSLEELRTYAFMLLVGEFNGIVNDIFYENVKMIEEKMKDIEISSKNQLIEVIKKMQHNMMNV